MGFSAYLFSNGEGGEAELFFLAIGPQSRLWGLAYRTGLEGLEAQESLWIRTAMESDNADHQSHQTDLSRFGPRQSATDRNTSNPRNPWASQD